MDTPEHVNGARNRRNSHGILKKRPRLDENRRAVLWDETNLADNERQKTAKMKIDEPKTPYHHPNYNLSDSDDDDGEQHERYSPKSPRSPGMSSTAAFEKWEQLHTAIEQEKDRQAKDTETHETDRQQRSVQMSLSETGDMDLSHSDGDEGEITQEKAERKKRFAEKRKQHYNEFQMVRKFKEQHQKVEDED